MIYQTLIKSIHPTIHAMAILANKKPNETVQKWYIVTGSVPSEAATVIASMLDMALGI
jgi:hypothetical protein